MDRWKRIKRSWCVGYNDVILSIAVAITPRCGGRKAPHFLKRYLTRYSINFLGTKPRVAAEVTGRVKNSLITTCRDYYDFDAEPRLRKHAY